MTLNEFFGIPNKTPFITKEKHERYQEIWYKLLNGKLNENFTLEFQKKFESSLYEDEFFNKSYKRSDENELKKLRTIGWRKGEFDKQHWGNWLHSLSPYQGRITPSLSHWLVKIFSKRGDKVLDPFMGIGTVPLEADLLGRRGIGVDLNIYAWLIGKAKFERKPIQYYLNYLREIKNIDRDEIEIDEIPQWIQDYYHSETLKEIKYINKKLWDERELFLLACLMGIIHGNRPGYLSVYTGCIIPMKPRKPEHPNYRPKKDKPEYRAVIPRLAAKVKRMYSTGFPLKTESLVYHADARDLPLFNNSVDVIISSPPYYDTLDYAGQNKVRLFFLGLDKEEQEKLSKELIQDKETYLDEMVKVGSELKRVLKPNGKVIYILGDVHKSKSSINTAENISQVYQNELNFKELAIVNDEIPLNKVASGTKRKKFDRVLVLKNIK